MAPLVITNIFNVNPKRIEMGLVLQGIYNLQYCVNFFVYAARNEQYRNAYAYLFKEITKSCRMINLRKRSSVKHSNPM